MTFPVNEAQHLHQQVSKQISGLYALSFDVAVMPEFADSQLHTCI